MTGFEPGSSGVGSNHAVNWPTVTAQLDIKPDVILRHLCYGIISFLADKGLLYPTREKMRLLKRFRAAIECMDGP